MDAIDRAVAEIRGWILEIARCEEYQAVDPEDVRQTYSRLLQHPDAPFLVTRHEVIAVFEWHRQQMAEQVERLLAGGPPIP